MTLSTDLIRPMHAHACHAHSALDYTAASHNTILFARRGEPYHPDHAALLRSYVQLQERAVLEYRSMLAAEDDFDLEPASQHARECAEPVFHPDMSKSLKRKIRKKTADMRLHPMRPDWLVVLAQLRTGDHMLSSNPALETYTHLTSHNYVVYKCAHG